MQSKITYQSIWNVSYPIILGGVAQTVVNITDTAFLGRVSEVAIGASAIAGLFYVTVFMLGWGFSIGTQIMIARYDGEKNYRQIGRVLDHSLYFMFPLAFVLYAFLRVAAPIILTQFVHSNAVLQSSIIYIENRSWGLFFAFIAFSIRSFYTGIASTRIVIYSTIVMALVNFVLNFVFVMGKWGIAPMGIAGSAMASSIAEVVSLVFVLVYTYINVDFSKYRLFRFSGFQFSTLKRILKIAAPTMLQTFIALCSWFIFFLIVEKMGERSLAISNLIRNIYMILMIPLLGFSSATNTLVSNLIGQGRSAEVFILIKKTAVLCFFCTLILAAINLLEPRLSLSIFTNDLDLIESTLGTLYVITGSLMLFSVATVLLSAVSGSGNTLYSLLIEGITIVFYLAASFYAVMVLKFRIELVWCVEYVYFIFMALLSFVYLRSRFKPAKNE